MNLMIYRWLVQHNFHLSQFLQGIPLKFSYLLPASLQLKVASQAIATDGWTQATRQMILYMTTSRSNQNGPVHQETPLKLCFSASTNSRNFTTRGLLTPKTGLSWNFRTLLKTKTHNMFQYMLCKQLFQFEGNMPHKFPNDQIKALGLNRVLLLKQPFY